MKRMWRGALVALLVVLGAFMLWPRDLGEAFDTEESLAVSVTIFGITNGHPDNKTEWYELEPGSQQGRLLKDLLSRHTYHLTRSSLVGDDVIDGSTMTLQFIGSEGNLMTLTGGTAELFLRDRAYRLDYWGADRGTELCQQVLEILRG